MPRVRLLLKEGGVSCLHVRVVSYPSRNMATVEPHLARVTRTCLLSVFLTDKDTPKPQHHRFYCVVGTEALTYTALSSERHGGCPSAQLSLHQRAPAGRKYFNYLALGVLLRAFLDV